MTHFLRMHQYLNRIVAIDETWLRSYEPKLKSQSSEWHTSGSPKTAKLRRKQGNLKQLAIIVYDNCCVLARDYIPLRHIVKGRYYETYLKDKLRPAIRKKRPALLRSGVPLVHDNVTPNESHPATSKIEECN